MAKLGQGPRSPDLQPRGHGGPPQGHRAWSGPLNQRFLLDSTLSCGTMLRASTASTPGDPWASPAGPPLVPTVAWCAPSPQSSCCFPQGVACALGEEKQPQMGAGGFVGR